MKPVVVPDPETLRTVAQVLTEVRVLAAKVDRLLAANPAPKPARTEPFTATEFAAILKRKPRYVTDRCRTGRIKTLPGKPYRILPSEQERWIVRGGAR